MVDYISVTSTCYSEFQRKTADKLNNWHSMILKGWPDTTQETLHAVSKHRNTTDELAISDGIIYKGKRNVPPSMRRDTLNLINESHMGIVKCKQKVCKALLWPGMTQ